MNSGTHPRQLTAPRHLPPSEADRLAGKLLSDAAVVLRLGPDGGPADVTTQDGRLLLKYRPAAVPAELADVGYRCLRDAATESTNRGAAAGSYEELGLDREMPVGTRIVGRATALRQQPKKLDGTLSRTHYAPPVNSGIVGAFERQPRFPYCRLTTYTSAHRDRFAAAVPFVRAVDTVFATEMPVRYEAQMTAVRRTADDWVIPGTAFTTITVNRNWQTAVHQDAGDLRAGFGVMSCIRVGEYAGGLLAFPRYGVGVDLHTGDVVLADVHEWHGNTPLRLSQGAERLSLVFYYREKMQFCGTGSQELDQAKNRQGGPLFPATGPVRAARPADLEWVCKLCAANRYFPGRTWAAGALEGRPGRRALCVEQAGVIFLLRTGGGDHWCEGIEVAPACRRKGVGRRLVAAAGTPLAFTVHDDDPDAIAFWSALGAIRSAAAGNRMSYWSLT